MPLAFYTVQAMESLIKHCECRMFCYRTDRWRPFPERQRIELRMRSRIKQAGKRLGMDVITAKITEDGYVYIVGRKKEVEP